VKIESVMIIENGYIVDMHFMLIEKVWQVV